MYVVDPSSPVTLISTSFVPSSHVAEAPFSSSTSLTVISTVASALVGVAVTLFEAFVVDVVYSVTLELNVGDKVSDPIVSPDKVLLMGLRPALQLL